MISTADIQLGLKSRAICINGMFYITMASFNFFLFPNVFLLDGHSVVSIEQSSYSFLSLIPRSNIFDTKKYQFLKVDIFIVLPHWEVMPEGNKPQTSASHREWVIGV